MIQESILEKNDFSNKTKNSQISLTSENKT